MHSKIKEIRMRLGLSETQISSLLNISSYKYRRYENGNLVLPVEILVLLSIMYDISIDLLVFDKFSIDTVLKEASIKEMLTFSEAERFSILKLNLCKYCTIKCSSVNYRVVKNILADLLNKFSKNLYNLRCIKSFEATEMSSLLHVDIEYYKDLENGDMWPTVFELVEIVSAYSKSIDDMFEIK